MGPNRRSGSTVGYSSERSSLVYPEKGIEISFIYKDSFKKARDCALSEIR